MEYKNKALISADAMRAISLQAPDSETNLLVRCVLETAESVARTGLTYCRYDTRLSYTQVPDNRKIIDHACEILMSLDYEVTLLKSVCTANILLTWSKNPTVPE